MVRRQGVGGPCCARILTSWFATSERGTYWGMWNIAHNLGGFSAPLLAGSAARSLGWKWGMSPFIDGSGALARTPALQQLKLCTLFMICWLSQSHKHHSDTVSHFDPSLPSVEPNKHWDGKTLLHSLK